MGYNWLLGFAGVMSLCCLGFGALAGGAAVAGTGATAVTLGGDGSVRGAVVTGAVTAVTVFTIAGILRWRLD